MGRTYYKACRDCGEQIQMSPVPSGGYQPFDPGGDRHHCSSAGASAPPPVVPIAEVLPSTRLPLREARPREVAVELPNARRFPWWVLALVLLIVAFLYGCQFR